MLIISAREGEKDFHISKDIKYLGFFCMKLKISMTTEPIEIYNLEKLHIDPRVV